MAKTNHVLFTTLSTTGNLSRVDQGLTPLTPQQNRTCAINAYGSSLNIPISPIEQTHSYLRLS